MLTVVQKNKTENFSFYNTPLFFSTKSKRTSRKTYRYPTFSKGTFYEDGVKKPKKLKFRIASKKLFIRYTQTDVPLYLILEHLKKAFGLFGLRTWLIVGGAVDSQNQRDVYVFLECERKIESKNPDVTDLFFNLRVHKGVCSFPRSKFTCGNYCILALVRPADDTKLLASPDAFHYFCLELYYPNYRR